MDYAVVYLLIASEGEYSDHHTWVVQAFTNEAEAIEEAARLNVKVRTEWQLYRDYRIRRDARHAAIRAAHPEWPKRIDITTEEAVEILKKIEILDKPEADLDPMPKTSADDHTIVAIPIGERGCWHLP